MFLISKRLIKWVVSKIIIDQHMEKKRINDKLPPHRRKVMLKISDLQIPRFEAGAIGCLHEAAEIYRLCMFCFHFFRFFNFLNGHIVAVYNNFDNSKILAMFGNATLATYHRNRVTCTLEDIRLIR